MWEEIERPGIIISVYSWEAEAQPNLDTCPMWAANQRQHHVLTVLSLHSPPVPRVERLQQQHTATQMSRMGQGPNKRASPAAGAGGGGEAAVPQEKGDLGTRGCWGLFLSLDLRRVPHFLSFSHGEKLRASKSSLHVFS